MANEYKYGHPFEVPKGTPVRVRRRLATESWERYCHLCGAELDKSATALSIDFSPRSACTGGASGWTVGVCRHCLSAGRT